eukprot:SAG11_NODE_7723_length_1104_cov_1.527363_1_plen_196_part_00
MLMRNAQVHCAYGSVGVRSVTDPDRCTVDIPGDDPRADWLREQQSRAPGPVRLHSAPRLSFICAMQSPPLSMPTPCPSRCRERELPAAVDAVHRDVDVFLHLETDAFYKENMYADFKLVEDNLAEVKEVRPHRQAGPLSARPSPISNDRSLAKRRPGRHPPPPMVEPPNCGPPRLPQPARAHTCTCACAAGLPRA